MAVVTVCDICGTSKNVNHLSYALKRMNDSVSGLVIDTDGKTYDLCQTHELIILKAAIKKAIKSLSAETEFAMNECIIREIKRRQNENNS